MHERGLRTYVRRAARHNAHAFAGGRAKSRRRPANGPPLAPARGSAGAGGLGLKLLGKPQRNGGKRMFHERIRPLAELEGAAYHAQHCGCADCASSRDPIGFARRRRMLKAQAAAFGLAVLVLYGLVIRNAAGIAAAFGLGQ